MLTAFLAVSGVQADTLTGRVLNGSGVAIEGARVVAWHLTDSTAYYATTTDVDGRYTLAAVIAGSYQLRAVQIGYEVGVQAIEVSGSGETAVYDFTLALLSNGGGDNGGTPPDTTGGGGGGTPIDSTGSGVPVGSARVIGFVRDANSGLPVQDAAIRFEGANNDGTLVQMSTWENGFFDLGLGSGDYTLTVHSSGFDAYTPSELFELGEGSVDTLDLVLSPRFSSYAVVEGQVVDSQNRPVPVARVFLNYTETLPDGEITGRGYRATTDADGVFQFENVVPLAYQLVVRADGFELEADELEVADGAQVFYTATLNGAGDAGSGSSATETVQGRVTFDESGVPAPGKTVGFLKMNGPNVHTETLADGTFSATVESGDYFVIVSDSSPDSSFAYWEYYDDVTSIAEATPLTIADGQILDPSGTVITSIDMGIPDFNQPVNVTVSGTVTDSAGQPLSGVLMTATNYDWNGEVRTAVTDANGQYTVNVDLYYQRLLVSAELEGYGVVYYPNQTVRYLAEAVAVDFRNPTVADINFALAVTGSVGNPVGNAITGQVVDESGATVAGTLVTGFSTDSDLVFHTHTDANGVYELDNLPVGSYYVLFASDDYAPQFNGNAESWVETTPIQVEGIVPEVNARFGGLNRPLGGTETITGRTHGDGSRVITGALVTVRNPQGVVDYTFSDLKGGYSIENLFPGMYTVRVQRVGLDVQEEDVTIDQNAASRQVMDFRLTTSASTSVDAPLATPQTFTLDNNYPNPFNPSTTIQYTLNQEGWVSLKVFDVQGRLVTTIVEAMQRAKTYAVSFEAPADLPSGVYFMTLQVNGNVQTRPMVLLK